MRRLLLVLVLVLALAVTGCVQITNPQFDARYRYHAEPLAPTTYAVFAIRLSELRAGTTETQLVIVDVAKRSVVGTMPIGAVRVVSDLGSGASGGEATMAAAKDTAFEEIDVARRTIRAVTTSMLTSSVPAGVGYDRGVRLLWTARPSAVDFVRRPSNEQTATLDLSRFLKKQLPGSSAEVGPLWYAGSTSTQDAFFVSPSTANSKTPTDAIAWKADFLTHAVSAVGTPTPWPAVLEPTPEMHVERAIRRWGVPKVDNSGQVCFLSPVDFSVRAVLPAAVTAPASPAVAPRILFEPGGDRYFTVEPGAPIRSGLTPYATRIMERSLSQPDYKREMPVPAGQLYPAANFRPLGVMGDTYAYVGTVGTHLSGANGHVVLALRDLKTGAVSQVAQLLGTPDDLDYLGSYTR